MEAIRKQKGGLPWANTRTAFRQQSSTASSQELDRCRLKIRPNSGNLKNKYSLNSVWSAHRKRVLATKSWRLKNLFTYELAKRAKQRHRSIYAQVDPPQYEPYFPRLIDPDYRELEPPSPEELAARRKAADEQAKAELGDAIKLVELGDVVTYEFLEKQLAIMERLEVMIARVYKKLLYVRGVKLMSFSTAAAPSQPRLGKAA
jgi:hypothetical protein